MRILYLHQYFKTPEEGGAIRSYYLASAMAAAGHSVDVLSGGEQAGVVSRQLNGFRVHYLPVAYSNAMDTRQRKSAFLRYLYEAFWQTRRLGKFDRVYASSTPLTVGILALYLKWTLGTPYFFEIRDLWPEAPWQLGAIKNPWLYRSLKGLERLLYRQARGVVALSPPMRDSVQNRAPHTPVLLAPNMADIAYFSLPAKAQLNIKPAELEDKFIISYTGAAGPANGLESLLKAAEACQKAQLPVLFLLMAQGKQLPMLREAAQGLSNLKLLPYGNKEQAKACLQASDAVYISFADFPVLQSCSPNKLFDGLAAGKLIITNTAGWLQELVESGGCGFYASAKDTASFTTQLQPFISNEDLLVQAQQNARQLAIEKFSRQELTERVLRFISS